MDDVVTKDGRVFYHLANVPYTRRDGSQTELAVWHSACVVCGASFTVTTPTEGRWPGSDSFGAKHCAAHKLTKAQVFARLQAGNRKRKAAMRAGVRK